MLGISLGWLTGWVYVRDFKGNFLVPGDKEKDKVGPSAVSEP